MARLVGRKEGKCYIYALIDPRERDVIGRTRYIGKTTSSLASRLSQHMSEARKGCATYRHKWIRSLLRLGVTPGIEYVLVADIEKGSECERYCIARFRDAGARLTNLTDGGEGSLGYVATPGVRAKMSHALKGRPKSAEHRAKISHALVGNDNGRGKHRKWGHPMTDDRRKAVSEGNKGRKMTDGQRASLSQRMIGNTFGRGRTGFRGYKHSHETRARMSASHAGKKLTKEHIANAARAQIGHAVSPETRIKIGNARRGHKHTEESRRKMSESRRGLTATVETRLKCAVARRAWWARLRADQNVELAVRGA